MEIDAQTVINKLSKNLSDQNAEVHKDKAILESQIEALQGKLSSLETENANLSNEIRIARSERYESDSDGYIEGDVLGS